MACGGLAALTPTCVVGTGVGAVTGSFMDTIANAFATAADKSVQMLVAGWTAIPTPSVSGGAGDWLQGQLQPLVLFVGSLSIIAAMVRMVWTSKAESAREMVAGLLRLVVVSGAGLAGIDILLKIGDTFSSSILNAATPQGGNFGQLAVVAGGASVALGAPVLVIILAAVAIIAAIIQIGLLLARGALVVVLGGSWPLSAAASASPAGKAWFTKTSAWLIAFVAFKPAAAIVYAAALRLMLAPNQGAIAGPGGLAIVEGVMLFAMALLALPAMIRLAVPAASAVGGISAGKVAAGAAILATGAVATFRTGGAAGAGAGGAKAGAAAAGSATGAVATAGNGQNPVGSAPPPPPPAQTGSSAGGSPGP